jgi:peptidoglycan biosynthesis protein MviN/MurJ (putative lipid II flippase)
MSAGLNTTLLLYALRRKLPSFDFRSMRTPLAAAAGAAILAGLTAWGAHRVWEKYLGHSGVLLRAGDVFVPIGLATALYFGISLWLHLPQARDVLGVLLSRFRSKAS